MQIDDPFVRTGGCSSNWAINFVEKVLLILSRLNGNEINHFRRLACGSSVDTGCKFYQNQHKFKSTRQRLLRTIELLQQSLSYITLPLLKVITVKAFPTLTLKQIPQQLPESCPIQGITCYLTQLQFNLRLDDGTRPELPKKLHSSARPDQPNNNEQVVKSRYRCSLQPPYFLETGRSCSPTVKIISWLVKLIETNLSYLPCAESSQKSLCLVGYNPSRTIKVPPFIW